MKVVRCSIENNTAGTGASKYLAASTDLNAKATSMMLSLLTFTQKNF
jgi:hypothetical protein